MHFRGWLALICLGVICFANAADETQSAFPSPSKPKKSVDKTAAAITGEKLSDALRIVRGFTNGTSEVIVTLAPSPLLSRTDFGSKAALRALRQEIKLRRQIVLDNLPRNEVRPGFQFAPPLARRILIPTPAVTLSVSWQSVRAERTASHSRIM